MTLNIQQVLAAIGFALCLALLAHHFLGVRRQAWLRMWWTMRLAQFRHWTRRRQSSPPPQSRRPVAGRREAQRPAEDLDRDAAREAADVIERARRQAAAGRGKGAEGGGAGGSNVVRPPRFGNRRNDLH
jgi:hypothetical protein